MGEASKEKKLCIKKKIHLLQTKIQKGGNEGSRERRKEERKEGRKEGRRKVLRFLG